ncbi:MAG TPA: selenide, water dikinase SelD [Actinomycetes bacterium]|nr:selenide, water dikinase SelD [Actinomycetes bacterium]
MTTAAELPRLTTLSHGAGCACKLPLATLDRLMASVGQGLGSAADANLLVGAAEGDDAAVFRLDDQRALVLTTDFFTPIVDDARDWGRIAAANALSDVYAMGGRPLIALNLTAWPADLPVELLAEVLRGGAEVAAQAGCPVVGGHSIDDPEPKYGLAVVGLADPERLLTIARARPGDRLVLTKPLGTGVVATAIKRGDPDPAAVAAAVAAMTTLNRDAAEAALAAGVEAATDVTGFGLLGHLHRMLRASGVAAQVDAARVPFLPGAAELAGAGFVSGGTRNNQAYLRDHVELEDGLPPVVATLLHDAQTSGGLLLPVDPERLGGLVGDLRDRGIEPAVIGRVVDGPPGRIGVRRLPPG